MLAIIFLLYNIILLPIFVLYFFYLLIRKVQGKGNISSRLGYFGKVPDRDLIWVHAASVGEVKAVIPLLAELKQKEKSRVIMISTLTDAGQEEARKISHAHGTMFLPLDFPFLLIPLFLRLKPEKLILVETELWPNLIMIASLFKTHLFLVNGRLSPGNFPRYYFFRHFFGPLLNLFTRVFPQSQEDEERFKALGTSEDRINLVGNLKLDGASGALSKEKSSSLREELAIGELLIVGGSTHPGEEEILLDIFKEIKGDYPALRLLLAPRHLDRVTEVLELVKSRGFAFQRRTGVNRIEDWEVLILDTMGELNKVYSLANAVFIGGSLVPKGGHNSIEALGRPLFFGPYMENTKEIAELLIREGLAYQVGDARSLKQGLLRVLKQREEQKELLDAAREFLNRHQGASLRTADIISEY